MSDHKRDDHKKNRKAPKAMPMPDNSAEATKKASKDTKGKSKK